jgi:hypothetical protein
MIDGDWGVWMVHDVSDEEADDSALPLEFDKGGVGLMKVLWERRGDVDGLF